VSPGTNIPVKLRKRFRAKIKVHYSFGECNYTASVRQSGDLKDHINFAEVGKPTRSLDVKM